MFMFKDAQERKFVISFCEIIFAKGVTVESTHLAPQHARMLGYLRFSDPPCEGRS